MNEYIKHCISLYGKEEARELVQWAKESARIAAERIKATAEAKAGMYIKAACFIPADSETDAITFTAIANELGRHGVERHYINGILYAR